MPYLSTVSRKKKKKKRERKQNAIKDIIKVVIEPQFIACARAIIRTPCNANAVKAARLLCQAANTIASQCCKKLQHSTNRFTGLPCSQDLGQTGAQTLFLDRGIIADIFRKSS